MASEIKVDTISEKTSAGGVTIDGLLIKDGGISGDVSLIGTTPTFTIGDAGAEDATLLFDGNAQDFHIGLDDTADDLVIGVGSTLGTTTALAIDENANTTFSGTVTVGVDDTGKDVKFFGATASAYMLWDESADDLILAGAAGLSVAGATATAALTASGIVKTDDTTEATSTTDGSLQTDGGLSVAKDAVFGDDIKLLSDSSVIHFGADSDITLTHQHNAGLLISNSTNSDTLELKSTDADANVGPVLRLTRDSSSPADGDVIGTIHFQGDDDGGAIANMFSLVATMTDVSAGAEDFTMQLQGMQNGSSFNFITIGGGATVINEDSNDLDFRIESTDAAKAFTIDGTKAHMHMTGTSAGSATKISDYSSGIGSIQLGIGCNIHSYDYSVLDGPYIFQNAWLSAGTAKYVGTGAAGRQGFYGGIWRFWNAASGSEDDDISWDERFRIALNGDLTATDTSIGSNSDSRLKENIENYTYDISKFKQFQPRTFDWKNPSQHNGASGNRGFVAQEVQAIDDYWIGEIELEKGTLDYDLIPEDESGEHKSLTSKFGKKDAMYISVIQQLIARIEALEA